MWRCTSTSPQMSKETDIARASEVAQSIEGRTSVLFSDFEPDLWSERAWIRCGVGLACVGSQSLASVRRGKSVRTATTLQATQRCRRKNSKKNEVKIA